MSYKSCVDFILESGLKVATVADVEAKRLDPSYIPPSRSILFADSIGVIVRDEGGETMFLPYSSIHMIGRFKEGS